MRSWHGKMISIVLVALATLSPGGVLSRYMDQCSTPFTGRLPARSV